MKPKTALYLLTAIPAVTVAMTFIQPTVIHQLVVWASGMFAVLVTAVLFVVSNWPQPQPQDTASRALECAVNYLRSCDIDDTDIALALSVTLVQVKAIPR